ncbi:ubiquitin-like-conjugating enzyme ATG10 isoform X1 [Papaver somniferum]|uniref:ubiquitin-like-conjugating enzyme ATG10 isoform X1 n=2 Tax=Papaver somniferum TaxID=3469 RepID=UPI000E702893|nr:ubiquitin-like-conjugating enzyme ATG10 isoform X1 [Papaver somniferum]
MSATDTGSSRNALCLECDLSMENLSRWDGTISSSEFRIAATTLSEKWKVINPEFPPWTWIDSPKPFWVTSSKFVSFFVQVEGYLSLETYSYKFSSDNVDNTQAHRNLIDTLCGYRSSCQKEEPVDFENEEELVDSATLVLNDDDQEELHHYDFHIVYSNSYRVPVLYFRGYRSDGQILTLDEVERDLPANSLKVLRESKWTFITQEEHPLLNRPWYTLHPCGTSEWMKLLFLGGYSQAKDGSSSGSVMQQYLVSWLSVVGQAVGLNVPLEMISDFHRVCTI